jgi:hypothetical protein
MFGQQLDYGIERYKDMLRDAERRRTGVYEGWYLIDVWEALHWRTAKAREFVRQASEWLWQWFEREGERCIELGPACELNYG